MEMSENTQWMELQRRDFVNDLQNTTVRARVGAWKFIFCVQWTMGMYNSH